MKLLLNKFFIIFFIILNIFFITNINLLLSYYSIGMVHLPIPVWERRDRNPKENSDYLKPEMKPKRRMATLTPKSQHIETLILILNH